MGQKDAIEELIRLANQLIEQEGRLKAVLMMTKTLREVFGGHWSIEVDAEEHYTLKRISNG